MNDAVMVGVILTLVFGAIIFYLYNRLSMTERKMGLFEGVLTDLKIMMDSAPFASGPPPAMYEFEPTPEYLNAISGPVPIQKDEVEDVDGSGEEDYQQTLEQALEGAAATEALEGSAAMRMLHIDEMQQPSLLQPAISVTKLSPDLDSLTVKELNGLAKQKGLSVPAGTRRKELIELLKKAAGPVVTQGTMLDGPGLDDNQGSPLNPLESNVMEVMV
jgi:hypothetical protein